MIIVGKVGLPVMTSKSALSEVCYQLASEEAVLGKADKEHKASKNKGMPYLFSSFKGLCLIVLGRKALIFPSASTRSDEGIASSRLLELPLSQCNTSL